MKGGKTMKKYLVFLLVVCLSVAVIGTVLAGHSTGKPQVITALYDANEFQITLTEMPENATEALLAHNKSINHIYVVEDSEEDEEDLEAFTPVLDAIQGDGFNPLWQEVRVIFTDPASTQQSLGLFSDNDIADANTAGTISLQPQQEIYRCSVIGPKEKGR